MKEGSVSVNRWSDSASAMRNCWPAPRRSWLTIIVLLGSLLAGNAFGATPDLSPDLSHYVVTYDGTHAAIEVIGPFGPGIAEAFRKEFEKHPDVKWVHLTSPGGLVVEGRRLRDLIYARQLNTYVRTACASACTLAFIGGAQRVLRRDAIFGFHQYSRLSYESLRQHVQDEDRSYFAGRGISPSFLAKMFQAESSSLWTLSADDAVKARLATEATERFEAPPIDVLPKAEMREVQGVVGHFGRFLAALQTYEPQMYEEFVITLFDATMSGASPRETQRLGETVSFTLTHRLVPTTSDQAAQSMASAFGAVYAELGRIGPQACVEAALGLPSEGDAWDRLSDAALRQLVEAAAIVVEDAHERPQQSPSAHDHDRLASEIARLLVGSMSASDIEFLSDTDGYKSDPDRLCRLMAGYMNALAGLPGHRGGALLRAMEAEE